MAVGAFLAGMGVGGGGSGLAVDACLCSVGSARLAQVAGHNEDAAAGVGPPRHLARVQEKRLEIRD